MALTAQGTQRIEIIVRKAGSVSVVGAKEKEAANANAEQTDQEGKGTSVKSVAFKKTQATHAFAVAKQVATQWFNYAVAGIGYREGDQALQQQLNREIEQVGDVTNIATSIAMGATYGSMGGPLGSFIGASLMGIQTASTTLLKYKTRERDYDMKLYKENSAIEYKRARAQINLTTGRLR